jgi:hypothetical protein
MKLTGFFILQCIKRGSTLRVSPKKEKPIPRVVFRSGSQNYQIADFLAHRTVVKGIMDKMQEDDKTKTTKKKTEVYCALTTQKAL